MGLHRGTEEGSQYWLSHVCGAVGNMFCLDNCIQPKFRNTHSRTIFYASQYFHLKHWHLPPGSGIFIFVKYIYKFASGEVNELFDLIPGTLNGGQKVQRLGRCKSTNPKREPHRLYYIRSWNTSLVLSCSSVQLSRMPCMTFIRSFFLLWILLICLFNTGDVVLFQL